MGSRPGSTQPVGQPVLLGLRPPALRERGVRERKRAVRERERVMRQSLQQWGPVLVPGREWALMCQNSPRRNDVW